MGSVCCSSDPTNSQINRYMAQYSKQQSQVKLLLLGTGSAGTLFKSLRCIHSGGVDKSDLMSTCPMTRANCIKAIQILFEQSIILYNKYETDNSMNIYKDCFVDTQNNEIKNHITRINNFDVTKLFVLSKIDWNEMTLLANSITYLWNLKGIKATYSHRGNNFAFEDNLDYFLNECKNIFDKNYVPTEQDYKKTKVRTIGMREYAYMTDARQAYRIIDVGGQRSDRRKWINYFEKLSAQDLDSGMYTVSWFRENCTGSIWTIYLGAYIAYLSNPSEYYDKNIHIYHN